MLDKPLARQARRCNEDLIFMDDPVNNNSLHQKRNFGFESRVASKYVSSQYRQRIGGWIVQSLRTKTHLPDLR